jgi:hypothetical protein
MKVNLVTVASKHLCIVNDEGLYALPPCGIFLPRLERPCAKRWKYLLHCARHAFQKDCTTELSENAGQTENSKNIPAWSNSSKSTVLRFDYELLTSGRALSPGRAMRLNPGSAQIRWRL